MSSEIIRKLERGSPVYLSPSAAISNFIYLILLGTYTLFLLTVCGFNLNYLWDLKSLLFIALAFIVIVTVSESIIWKAIIEDHKIRLTLLFGLIKTKEHLLDTVSIVRTIPLISAPLLQIKIDDGNQQKTYLLSKGRGFWQEKYLPEDVISRSKHILKEKTNRKIV